MSEKYKRYLVALSAFVYAIVFTYMLITGVAFQVAEQSSGGTELKYKLALVIAPVLFAYLGFHHLTKEQGIAGFSLLTIILGIFGVLACWLGITMIYDNDGEIFMNLALIIFGLIHLLLCYWCYQNGAPNAEEST